MVETLRESVCAKTHDPIYTVHRYFARRPHNAIANAIDHYTEKKNGKIIFDPFGGGGTTLIEALAANQRVITCDTSDLATFVMSQEAKMSSVDIDDVESAANAIMGKAVDKFCGLFSFHGKEVYWIMWSSWTNCPECENPTFLSQETTVGGGTYLCQNCGCRFKPKNVSISQIRPVAICLMDKGSFAAGKAHNPEVIYPTIDELEEYYETLLVSLNDLGFAEAMLPKIQFPDCNLQRESALHKKQLHYYEEFIPMASRAIIHYLGEEISTLETGEDTRQALFFMLSASLRYCARFSTINEAWRGKTKPLEWAKSNFWTPYTFVETNPLIGFHERLSSYKTAAKSAHSRMPHGKTSGSVQSVLEGSTDYSILNRSSSDMGELPDESIDLVVTDPPYGSYLNYGELSGFWTSWLSRFLPNISPVPNMENEAVPARKKGYPGWKNFSEYEEILYSVFKEAFRVLKKNAFCVVTFNNKEPEAWIAFLSAVKRAGFSLPEHGVIFQDGVSAYRRTIDSRRAGSIFGDFIYSFQKTSAPEIESDFDWNQCLRDTLDEISSEAPTIPNAELYTRLYLSVLPKLYAAINPKEDNTCPRITTSELEKVIQSRYQRNSAGIWTLR